MYMGKARAVAHESKFSDTMHLEKFLNPRFWSSVIYIQKISFYNNAMYKKYTRVQRGSWDIVEN